MQYIYDQNRLSGKVFDFFYASSMRDAVLQRAFTGKKDWLVNVETAKQPLRKYIDCIINNAFLSQEAHDSFFIKTANEICKAINENKPTDAEDIFSFGNAQKLINMMVKYIYSICYYASELRENFRYCHCPMDSVMLNEVWKSYKKIMGETKRKEELKNYEFFCQSWGNEGQQGMLQPTIDEFPERYLKFQTSIREIIGEGNLYPVEFDYVVWE